LGLFIYAVIINLQGFVQFISFWCTNKPIYKLMIFITAILVILPLSSLRKAVIHSSLRNPKNLQSPSVPDKDDCGKE